MTTVYFVRHAESDISVHDDRSRPLTPKGLTDRLMVTDYLMDRAINAVLSSPYKRSIDTVLDFAQNAGLSIKTVKDFRERRLSDVWVEDFKGFSKRQWEDFTYKLNEGESLKEVQDRNISALNGVLERHEGENIVIATHGTALSTIINYYDNTYNYEDFIKMVNIMPWMVRMEFEGKWCVAIEKIDLFTYNKS